MAEFVGADLRGSRFERVDLSGSEFRASKLSDTRLRGAYLNGVVMRGVESPGRPSMSCSSCAATGCPQCVLSWTD